MEYLIVYKWYGDNEVFNFYYTGSIKINLKDVEKEIRELSDEYEEDLVYLNIIQLGQKYK